MINLILVVLMLVALIETVDALEYGWRIHKREMLDINLMNTKERKAQRVKYLKSAAKIIFFALIIELILFLLIIL